MTIKKISKQASCYAFISSKHKQTNHFQPPKKTRKQNSEPNLHFALFATFSGFAKPVSKPASIFKFIIYWPTAPADQQ